MIIKSSLRIKKEQDRYERNKKKAKESYQYKTMIKELHGYRVYIPETGVSRTTELNINNPKFKITVADDKININYLCDFNKYGIDIKITDNNIIKSEMIFMDVDDLINFIKD